MSLHYSDATVNLHHGDCLDVLRSLPDASVDSVVTDPPYGLEFMGKEWDGADGFRRSLNAADAGRESVFGRASRTSPEFRAGRLFGEWCELWATECLRVLKPGGHLLAFGGTRTWHRLACAVEDAGFEVRDSIAWLYGSGFPKSLDVSKAIDKRANVNDETHRRIALVAEVIRTHREAKGMERAEVSRAVVGTPSGACWNWEHQQLPSAEMWPAIKRALDISDEFDGLIEGTRAQFIGAERAVIGTRTTGIGTGRGAVAYIADSDNRDVTAPATPDAERWQGWGTALKPAFEPVVVARKPLVGTVAANVLEHGTGALNIDGCRVGTEARPVMVRTTTEVAASSMAGTSTGATSNGETTTAGRWPANVVLDETQADALDEQSGELTSGANPTRRGSDKFREAYGDFKGQEECTPARGADTGGASRFFYVAKADASERPRVDGVAHPTVKPLALMRWLVRLVTPPGGTVLEPFAGSGTTVEACILEGFHCIAIEKGAEYLPLIESRIARRRDPVRAVELSGDDAGLFDFIDGEATA